MPSAKTGEQTGSRPSAAEGGGAPAPALSPSDCRSTFNPVAPTSTPARGSVAEVERIVRQIRARWPFVRILLRADSGFAREALMAWCEENRVDYLFGLARNVRLVAMIEEELAAARAAAEKTGRPARRFKDFQWSTRNTWSRRRRVIAKAEWTKGEANPRFVVTSLKRTEAAL